MVTRNRNRYQDGSLERVKRAKGRPDNWLFRWRELQPDGTRVQRKKVIGDANQYRSESAAKRAAENLRLEINSKQPRVGVMTIGQLWGDFEKRELRSTRVDRSPVTIDTYLDNMRLYILPKWKDTYIDEIRAVDVEEWLDTLVKSDKPKGRARGPNSHAKPLPPRPKKKPEPLAPATKAKLRNQMSCLYSHAIRNGFLQTVNPITEVRQSGKRLRTPDKLTLDEMRQIVAAVVDLLHRLAILIAASTGLRRSEIRGLKWLDIDFDEMWIHLQRGVVRKLETTLKTEGSKRGVPLPPDLAEVLKEWREKTLYKADNDWVFASSETKGKTPIWLDLVLKNYIKPVVARLGIKKRVGWHTWRHSLATLLAGKGEQVKVVQELLRHANARTTMDIYQEADNDAKRAAQKHTESLFLVKKAS